MKALLACRVCWHVWLLLLSAVVLGIGIDVARWALIAPAACGVVVNAFVLVWLFSRATYEVTSTCTFPTGAPTRSMISFVDERPAEDRPRFDDAWRAAARRREADEAPF